MNLSLSTKRAREYITIGTFILLVFLAGIISTVIANDYIIIAVTAGIILVGLFFLHHINPLYLLYTLCLGASFLPYINLNLFPLSGVYVVAFIFILSGFIMFFSRGYSIKFTPQLKWACLFLGFGIIISMIVAADKKAAIIYCGQFTVYLVIYTITVNILDEKTKIIRAFKYLLMGGIIPLVISFVQLIVSFYSIEYVIELFYNSIFGKLFSGSKGLERIGGEAAVILNRASNVSGISDSMIFRVFGTFEAPTIFGWYVLLIALLAGGLLILQTRKKQLGFGPYANGILFAFSLVCLVFTWTRSAMLAFIIVFSFILMYRKDTYITIFSIKNIKYFTYLVVIPAVILVAFTDVLSFNRLGRSTGSRLLTMIFSAFYIMQNPIIGTGFGNYRYVLPGVEADASEATFATAHNTYLELGVEVGLPGLILFLVLLYSFVKQAMALVRAPLNSFYHSLGILFTSIWIGVIFLWMFGGGLIHPRFMTLLWILAGMQAATYNLYCDEKTKKNTVYRLEVAH